jgi:hypothetical protein
VRLDREAMRAHTVVALIEAANLDRTLPRATSAIAVAGTLGLAALHLCRWLAP